MAYFCQQSLAEKPRATVWDVEDYVKACKIDDGSAPCQESSADAPSGVDSPGTSRTFNNVTMSLPRVKKPNPR